MTHARIYLIALSVLGLAIAGVSALPASASRSAAPLVETTPAQPAAADEAQHCQLPESTAPATLVAASTLPNNSCPPPKTCCGWKDPGHHICNRCC